MYTPNEMPTDKAKIFAYVDEELKKDFEKLCNAESRSISNMVEVLIRKAVDQAKKEKVI